MCTKVMASYVCHSIFSYLNSFFAFSTNPCRFSAQRLILVLFSERLFCLLATAEGHVDEILHRFFYSQFVISEAGEVNQRRVLQLSPNISNFRASCTNAG